MREQLTDAAAEAERAQQALRKADLRRKKDALRKRKARKEQRAPEAGKPSPADAAVHPSPDASTAGEGPLSDLVSDAPAAAGAADMQATAAAIAKQLDTPEKLAGLLAHLQVAAQEKAGRKHPRIAKVIGALDLADAKGSPTEWGKLAISFTWPWWQSDGLEFLKALDPKTQALIGLGMLVVPAAIVAFDQYQQHAEQREIRVRRALQHTDGRGPADQVTAPAQKPAGVVQLHPEEERAS